MKNINWGQAFAEVLLLLLGIGVALLADQWRDRSQERSAEQEHLVALRADFHAADSVIRVRLGAVEEQLDHNEALLNTLARPVDDMPGDSVARLLRKAFIDVPFGVATAAYTDLLNAGNLGLLKSEPLRRALAEFATANVQAAAYAEKASAQWAGPVTEFFVRTFNVTLIYGNESVVTWDTPNLDSPVYRQTPVVSRFVADEAALWSRELVNRIAVKNVTLDDAAFSARAALAQIEQVLALVDASID